MHPTATITQKDLKYQDIISRYDVKTWARNPNPAYRQVLSSPTFLPEKFEIECTQEITPQNFNTIGYCIADLLRPTSFSLDDTAEADTFLSVLRIQQNKDLYRRISGFIKNYYGSPVIRAMALGIYERKGTEGGSIDEVLYLFGLEKKESTDSNPQHVWEGQFIIDINEICSPIPHDMTVTYQKGGSFCALVEADRRKPRGFSLDCHGTKCEFKYT